MASPKYQATPQLESGQPSNHKARDFGNYDNDYNHEMYASGAVVDEKNHHQLKGYSYRGKFWICPEIEVKTEMEKRVK